MTKFEDTVKEMESQVEELENDLADKADQLDDAGKEKAKALVEKTEEAIKSSIEKVRSIINDVQEDDKLDEFLDKVKAKSMEAVDFTKGKVNELTQKANKDNRLDKLGEDIMAEFDKLKESDAYKKTADFLSDISAKVNDYFNKPEVKEVINPTVEKNKADSPKTGDTSNFMLWLLLLASAFVTMIEFLMLRRKA